MHNKHSQESKPAKPTTRNGKKDKPALLYRETVTNGWEMWVVPTLGGPESVLLLGGKVVVVAHRGRRRWNLNHAQLVLLLHEERKRHRQAKGAA